MSQSLLTPEKTLTTVKIGDKTPARSTAEEKALHDEVAVPKVVENPRLNDKVSVITVEQKPGNEMELKDVVNSQSESSEDATEAKVSSPVEPEVDSSEALNAPAPLEDDVSDERDEFINQASQLASLLPDDVDISPRAAAEYLMVTGDFDSFDQAIADLVASDLLTMGDAERYREAVNYEFDLLTRLLLETQQTFDQPELSQPSEDAQPLPETQADSDEAQAAAYPEPSDVDVDTAVASEPDSRPSADQLQSFLANEATLGEMLQLLSQQYQMKTSQSEPTTDEETDVKGESNNKMKNVIDLLSDSMKQDAASAAERLKQHDASSDNDKNAETELEALTHKGARS
ncbi:hypothetical protein NP493_178g02008 [Ridgeia piscesae]|uniref:Uncharacterized protein n=1 Tax=Ridgeia piscesae TaxID=27915 RepID=A0AAD9P2R1_RIDPI|nr:hypothetical protein NP493_178g02008 [Ridgeia piscesae]